MFQIVEGVSISDLRDVEEGYCKIDSNGHWRFVVNVSAENIDELFRRLCTQVRAPSFLLLEHGATQYEEEALRESSDDSLHIDVFYLDGLSHDSFINIYNTYHELLINDGQISYGFGSHIGLDEIYVGPFKVFTIMTDTPEKYEIVLDSMGFVLKDDIKTVFDTFTPQTPGERFCLKKNGIDIYEMVEQLKKKGLYFAEHREST